jgi:hypothetical protein
LGRRRPVGAALIVVGGVLLITSAFLEWLPEGPKGTGVPIQFLWSPAPRPAPNFFSSLGFVVMVLGVLSLLGATLQSGFLPSLAGVVGIVVFVLALITLYRVETPYPLGIGNVGIGAWLVLVGGLIALIGSFLRSRARP